MRLTAPDGYQAQRSYSIGSAPDGDTIELVVERLDDGEVSPFFHEVVAVGDAIEMRGPIGGHFNWRPEDGGPILLVGGGSGVVPLMSMLRERQRSASEAPFVLVYSARTFADVIFRDELMRHAEADPGFSLILALTREAAPVAGARLGRINREVIADALTRLGGAASARLHLRRHCLCRGRVDVPGRGGRPAGPRPHRALWRHSGRETRPYGRRRPGIVTGSHR